MEANKHSGILLASGEMIIWHAPLLLHIMEEKELKRKQFNAWELRFVN